MNEDFERHVFMFEISEVFVPSISTPHSSQSNLTKEIALIPVVGFWFKPIQW